MDRLSYLNDYNTETLVRLWDEEVKDRTASDSWLNKVEDLLTARGYYTRTNFGARTKAKLRYR